MLVYDFETFKHNTLLGVLNEETGEIIQTWDISEIKELAKSQLSNIWIGYNCEHYDKILLHGIMTDKLTNSNKIFDCSSAVINAQDSDIPVFNVLGKYGINDYYASPLLSYDVMGDGSFMSLKQNEGFMRYGYCRKCCSV